MIKLSPITAEVKVKTVDKIDHKLLYYLHYNARTPLSKLAKNIGISKQNLNYRLKRLVRLEVIQNFMTVIDIHRLGFLTYRIYLRYKNVNEKKEQEIINYLKNHKNVLWLVSIIGSWDLEIVFVARNYIHFNNIFKKIKEDFGAHFSKYNISYTIVNYHFKRDYLINQRREGFSQKYYGFEPKQEYIDKLDVRILLQLSENCRQSNQEIGQKLSVTYHTIKNRIMVMEKKQIIQTHRITINLNKLNYHYYKALIRLNNPTKEEEKKIYTFCSQYNFVTYLVEIIGEWQFEVECEVENQNQFIDFLRKLRNHFPELILDYDMIQITKEHKLNYFPTAEETLKQMG